MRTLWSICTAIPVALGLSLGAQAQDVYTLGFEGPSSVAGLVGEDVGFDVTATLEHAEGDGVGAQGWSIGIRVDGAEVVGVTTEGTSVDGLFDEGFNKSKAIDPILNDGKNGATSAVVLCYGCENVLPPSATILQLSLSATIAEDADPISVEYEEGLIGEGQPVRLVVTQLGQSIAPMLEALSVPVRALKSCLNDKYSLGFATENLVSDTPFAEGSVGTGEPSGHASGEGMTIAGAPGEIASAPVWATIITNESDPEAAGVQGWSLSIEALGAANITGITWEGTVTAPVPDGLFDSGFEKTLLAAAEDNDGRSGATSAVVLCFGCDTTIGLVGTTAVAELTVESRDPLSADAPQSGRLEYNPLRSIGQQVDIVLTVLGTSVPVCNLDSVGLDIEFEEVQGKGPYIRGDANDDGKLNIADGIWIINELFKMGPESVCQTAADANNSNTVDLADAVFIFEYRFLTGPAPEAPFPDCGFIPIDAGGDLTCGGNSSCL